MAFKNQYFILPLILCLINLVISLPPSLTKDSNDADSGTVLIQVTNRTQVPNIVYTLHAIESLKMAFSIFNDEFSRARAWAELFGNSYAGRWNVAIGYSTLLINSTISIEVTVKETGENKVEKGKDSKPKSTSLLYGIFN